MRKRIIVSSDGTRSISIGDGNLTITANADDDFEEIDVSEATDVELDQLIDNPHDTKLIDKLTKRKNKTKI